MDDEITEPAALLLPFARCMNPACRLKVVHEQHHGPIHIACGTAHAEEAECPQQLPIPVPTKLGAVVWTERGLAVLADWWADEHNTARWILNLGEPGQGYKWASDDDIGRITAVLSEGVDL